MTVTPPDNLKKVPTTSHLSYGHSRQPEFPGGPGGYSCNLLLDVISATVVISFGTIYDHVSSLSWGFVICHDAAHHQAIMVTANS